jgi:hypothetical protein
VRSTGWFERALLLIVLVALAGRVTYIAVSKTEVDTCGRSVCGDALFYSGEANVVARGRGFQELDLTGKPAADHPPLTVAVLAITNLPFLWTTADDNPVPGGLPPPNMFVQRLTMAVLGALVVGGVVAVGLTALIIVFVVTSLRS